MKNQDGQSLFELLITLSVAAFILTMSVGFIASFFYHHRLRDASAQILSRLQFAFNKAHLNQHSLILCPSNDHQHCAKDWSQSWILIDKHAKSDGITVLHEFSELPAGIAIGWQGWQSENHIQVSPFEKNKGVSGHFSLLAEDGQAAVLTVDRTGNTRALMK